MNETQHTIENDSGIVHEHVGSAMSVDDRSKLVF